MKNNIHLKIRDLVRRGGNRSYGKLTVKSPMVSATSAADKVGGNIAKQQAEMDDELVEMNKKLSGGAVTVPQIGAQEENLVTKLLNPNSFKCFYKLMVSMTQKLMNAA